MDQQAAIELLTAAGFKVTRPKAKKCNVPALNAVGKPFSAQYDPGYRMKYKPPRCTKSFSTATSRGAHSAYRAAIAKKHAGNAELIAEIYARNGVK